ncbi:hypothetical protein ACFSKY_13635 [Azotobacter chroococcum]|uniref:Uncharacterized protein n=1 Tax=Azotobacter chroococcum TaxID=353 RepID=A0A4R1P5W3_9GAMM|nr:hypothetical protein [Azotobacter chroococcum]TCL21537.1 hypothetical protein EV691_14011 [Azotobacter chroococcum]
MWSGRERLELPGDIRPLIEATYAARPETDAMARWLDELEKGSRHRLGRQALRQLARVALAEDGVTLPESKAQTRYSETESGVVLRSSPRPWGCFQGDQGHHRHLAIFPTPVGCLQPD